MKPFEQAELVARVRAALRTKAVRDGFVERATRDGLTGLLNRREIDVHAEAAVSLAQRHGRSVSFLMVDIDHFKRINDRYGHAAGDEVLREVARRIFAACRTSDAVGRYGGEEFLLVLPETFADDAVTTATRSGGFSPRSQSSATICSSRSRRASVSQSWIRECERPSCTKPPTERSTARKS